MKVWFANFAKAEDGNAVIDWMVLMAGMVLMAVSIVMTVTSNVDTITEDTMDRVEQMEDFHPV